MRVIDSHTEGEPTRTIIEGGPDLGTGPLRDRLRRFRETADAWRRMAILEPRGSEAVVGALLCEPEDPACAAGVIFFNNAGFLNMCGHGAIGVAVTLGYLGRIGPGRHSLETPVGRVDVELVDANQVSLENVPSWRERTNVAVEVEGIGRVTGDVAWGGNWFFLVERSPIPVTRWNISRLTNLAYQIRGALVRQGITGRDGADIDHIEFFGPAESPDAQSRNFVFCPGGAFDRSPCGTGTSAKLACLAAAGKLKPGERWVQESILGSCFTASYRTDAEGRVIPRIAGRAYIVAEATLLQQPGDPFEHGIDYREST